MALSTFVAIIVICSSFVAHSIMAARAQAMAAAQAVTSYEDVLTQPIDEILTTLNGASYRELQGFCHHIGVKAAGTQAELLARAIDHVKSTTDSPASPEGRDGRARSPRAGKAASALRKAAPKAKAQSPTVAEFIGDTPSLPKSSAPLPAVQPMPGFAATVDEAHAGHNPLISGSKAAGMPVDVDTAGAGANVVIRTVPGAEIDAGQAQAHAEMAVDESEASDASAVSDAPEVTGEVSTNDLMRKLNTMEKQRKADKAQIQKKIMAQTKVMISEAVDPLKDGLAEVQSSVKVRDAQIQKLRTDFEQFRLGSPGESSGPNPFDPALKQVAFIGFPEESTVAQRIEAMVSFMQENFPELQIKHTDLSMDKNGKQTRNGFVELGSKKHARHVTSTTKSRGLKVQGYAGVTVKPENTDINRNRNWALREAEKLIRQSPKFGNGRLEVKKAQDRGVYVDGLPAFTQKIRFAKGGVFHGIFADLKLP